MKKNIIIGLLSTVTLLISVFGFSYMVWLADNWKYYPSSTLVDYFTKGLRVAFCLLCAFSGAALAPIIGYGIDKKGG